MLVILHGKVETILDFDHLVSSLWRMRVHWKLYDMLIGLNDFYSLNSIIVFKYFLVVSVMRFIIKPCLGGKRYNICRQTLLRKHNQMYQSQQLKNICQLCRSVRHSRTRHYTHVGLSELTVSRPVIGRPGWIPASHWSKVSTDQGCTGQLHVALPDMLLIYSKVKTALKKMV